MQKKVNELFRYDRNSTILAINQMDFDEKKVGEETTKPQMRDSWKMSEETSQIGSGWVRARTEAAGEVSNLVVHYVVNYLPKTL